MNSLSFQRPQVAVLTARLNEPRRFIQVVAGPRQAGKSTLVQQATERLAMPVRQASADEPTLRGTDWIAQQWEAARLSIVGPEGAVLVLDEIQKIPGWSETVKRLWDEDTRARRPLKVVVLGSAPLLIAQGLTESLAGRFETLAVSHWSLAEMRAAFGWSLDEYVFHGGYPGAAPLIGEPQRWSRYVLDSLIETSISRDVLLLTRVDKPALLRRLFELACRYSGQVLSYTKMLGQLQDGGIATSRSRFPTKARSSPNSCPDAPSVREATYQSEAGAGKGLHRAIAGAGLRLPAHHLEAELLANLRRQLERLNKITFSDTEWERFFTDLHRRRQRRHRREKPRASRKTMSRSLKRDDGTTKNIYLIDKANIHNNALQVINQYEG
jgi:hypothetical protein